MTRKNDVEGRVRRSRPRARYARGDLPTPQATELVPAHVRNEPSAVYVKLPIAPELAAALHEHAENGKRLVDLLLGGNAAAKDVVDAFVRTVTAVRRDVNKVRARAKKRRRR